MYAVCELNVRTILRCVSASGQSHAVSMWAWPIADELVDVRAVAVGEERASGSPRASSQVERSSSTQTLQKRLSSERSSPGPRLVEPVRGVGLEPAEDVEVVVQIPRPAVEAGDPAAVEDDRLERRVRAAASSPNLPLQASSTRRSSRSPPAAGSSTGASIRAPSGLEFSPCTGRPSIQSVASLWLTHARSTRSPAHSAGTVASTRNQYVAHSGPNRSPSAASR